MGEENTEKRRRSDDILKHIITPSVKPLEKGDVRAERA